MSAKQKQIKEIEVTTKYYEFLKALKSKLRGNGNLSMIKFSKDQWGMPPQVVTVMKNMGWLDAHKNIQHKWVYNFNLSQIEPWHGETLKQHTRSYMKASKAHSEANFSKKEISGDLEEMFGEDLTRLTVEDVKKSNEETVKRLKEKFEQFQKSGLENFSDEEIVNELRKRGYELKEIWKKVLF